MHRRIENKNKVNESKKNPNLISKLFNHIFKQTKQNERTVFKGFNGSRIGRNG